MGVAESRRGIPVPEALAACVSPCARPRGAATAALGEIPCRCLKYLCISPEFFPAGVPLVTALVLYFFDALMPVLSCSFAGERGL